MILSTKGRYAVMAAVELGLVEDGRPLSLSYIAEKQEIPLAYLEQIFAKLKKRGIVESVRGPGGGYRLSEAAENTWILDIILAAEESIEMTRCGGHEHVGCMAPKTRCLTHDLWQGLTNHIETYLKSISLADVCNREIKAKRKPNPALLELQTFIQQA